MAFTFAQSIAHLGLAVKMLDQQKKYFDTNTPNVRTMEAAIVASYAGEFSSGQGSQLESKVLGLRSGLDSNGVRAFLKPFLDDVSYAIDAPRNGWEGQLISLRDYMVANSKTIEERTMSYGTVTAGGSNVGNGIAPCLTVDKFGNQLQSASADTLTLTCLRDGSSGGTKNAETFRATSGYDYNLANIDEEFQASYDGNNLLSNPRFQSYSGPAIAAGAPVAPNAVGNFSSWTLSGTAPFLGQMDVFTRYEPGGATRTKAINFGNGNMYQELTEARKTIDPDVPLLPAALFYKVAGATGNITIAWGSKSQVITVASLTNTAWNWVYPDRDLDLWYDNWKQNASRITITVDTLAVAAIHIQEAGLYKPVAINGAYYWLLGGSTPFVKSDLFTQAVSQSADGLIQRWLLREARTAARIVLPHAGAPTEADPS